MNIIFTLRRYLDRFLFAFNVVLLVLLVVDVTWQVFSRYALNSPSTFTDEAARFLMIWMSFLGGAYLFGRHGHLSVTILSDRFSPKTAKIVSLISYLLIGGFAVLVMIYGSDRLIEKTWLQPSPSLGVSMGMFYLILPISACCIIFYMLAQIAEELQGKAKSEP